MKRWKAPRCKSRKAAFRNQGAALRALQRIQTTNRQAAAAGSKEPVRAYRCDCGAWHLTSKP